MKTLSEQGIEAISKDQVSKSYAIASAVLLLTLVGGLIAYKTSASFAVIEKVQATGVLKPRFDLVSDGGVSARFAFSRTFNYFSAVWPALLFGVLISGAVRTLISPQRIVGLFGKGQVRPQLMAGLEGAPLMLCSCCVAPIFTSVSLLK
jgi:hypothetical protein